MKNLFFLGFLVVLIASLFAIVAPVVLADDGENLKKAGQQALAEKEKILLEKKAKIEALLPVMAADRVIVCKEMIALNRAIDDFEQTKKDADAYLSYYELVTTTALDKEMVQMVKTYYEAHLLYKSDVKGIVRTYFTRLTGEDIIVPRSGVNIAGAEIGMMLSVVALLIGTILCILTGLKREKEGRGGSNYAAATLLCIFLVVLLVACLFA